jgi:4-hydroxy-tetrahydrodipicolinate reductase
MDDSRTTHLAIHGAAGRMGQRLVALAYADPQLTIATALEAEGHPQLGRDAGVISGVGEIGVPLRSQLDAPDRVDVVIDFSVPKAAVGLVESCRERRLPVVVATTGFDERQEVVIRGAAQDIPLVWAPNMSLAVNLAMKLCETAAAALARHSSGVDVEIIERHHRFKEDAPSGTALKFGQMIARHMGQTRHQHGREGRPGARPQGEIGYHAIRAGDNPGEHTIIFGLLGETLEVRVAATSRDSYAQGALAAARWLVGKPPRLYGMSDVLGL